MSAKNKATTLHVENVKKGLQAEINKLKNRVEKLEHRKQPTQAAGSKKGPKKARLPKLTGEDQIAHIERIKVSDKSKKEKSKEITAYVEGEVAAGRAPVTSGAAIPRQPRAHKPEYNGEDKEFIQVINNGPGTRAEKNRKIREYHDEIRPYRGVYVRKPRSAQTPAVAAAVDKVKAAEGKVDALHQELHSPTLTPAEVKVVGKELGEALEEKAAAAADAAAVAANEGDDETAEDMQAAEADAVTEGNQLPDAVQDAVTKSQYRSPSFGAGLGRRAMLSRWG